MQGSNGRQYMLLFLVDEKTVIRTFHYVRGPTRWRAIKEGIKVVKRDWVNHQSMQFVAYHSCCIWFCDNKEILFLN